MQPSDLTQDWRQTMRRCKQAMAMHRLISAIAWRLGQGITICMPGPGLSCCPAFHLSSLKTV